MKSMPKWFLIPPAVAAMLVLGTLTMGNGSPKSAAPKAPAAVVAEAGDANVGENQPATAAVGRSQSIAGPKAPDFSQMVAALAAVLGLGVAGVYVLRQLRGPARASGGIPLLTLRQSLRLSPKQALHAIEFDERIVLVGESDRGLTLIDGGRLPERAADEAEVVGRPAGRALDVVADDDDGAVPKNLVIPRPEQAPARRSPTPPATKAAASARPTLADFRNLLQQAGRS
ncbi:MAG: FliO/MopB family protein [Planctomycetes bacterium]|nr:FliO/MopB family protein [Planctomycetota bacterium]